MLNLYDQYLIQSAFAAAISQLINTLNNFLTRGFNKFIQYLCS